MNSDRSRLWTDVGEFVVCILLYILLLWVGALIIFWFIEPKMSPTPILDGWLWVLAFPARGGHHLNPGGPLAWALIVLDPFVYGGGGWLAWRMFRLMRSKPRGDDFPE